MKIIPKGDSLGYTRRHVIKLDLAY